MMHTYHVHTEWFPNVEEIASRHFDGFTLNTARGFWKGQDEPTAVIEIATDNAAAVRAFAEDLKATNRQESVLIERYDTVSELI